MWSGQQSPSKSEVCTPGILGIVRAVMGIDNTKVDEAVRPQALRREVPCGRKRPAQ